MDTKLKDSPETNLKTLYEQWQQVRFGNIYPEYQHPFALTYDELISTLHSNIFSDAPKSENI